MVGLTAEPTQRLVALCGELDVEELRPSDQARKEVRALVAGHGPVNQHREEELFRAIARTHPPSPVVLEAPPAAP
jgi:hypothetical protein